ncbi:MAG: bacterial Ig-like domain-containing protein, partial [Clostridia bacterium]|nr:bacterial Ig-like domain-containing protein [Clostridia bacterium]
ENYSSKSSSVSYNNGVYKGVTGYESGYEKYVGNGNHNCSVADMNGDGKDEVVTGALCYYLSDDKLKPMWCTYKGHGDAIHIGKYDPTNPNFDIFVIHEEGGWTDKLSGNNVVLDFGYSVINSENGNIKFHKSASSDTGRGMMANVGMGGYYQVWASNGLGRPYSSYGNGFFLQPDESLTEEPKFRIFWDGDLYDELLYKTWIDSWDDDSRSMQKIFETTGCSPVSGTTPALQADILGDWREEVCYPTTDGTKLRVYTTDIYTNYKIMSLMNDRTYECGVIAQQTAYNQPPHIGFYLDEGVLKGGIEKLTIDSLPDKTKYSTRESVDIDGLKVKAQYADGTSGYITGYSITGLDTSTEGNKTVTISSGGKSATFGITVETPTGSVLLSDPENMAPSNQKNLQFGGTETEGNVYGKIDGAYKLSNSVATVSNGSQGFYTDADIFGSINVAMDTDSTAILHFGKSGPGTHYQALSFKAGSADEDETISVVAGEKNRTSTVTMTLRPQTWYNVEYYVNRAEYKGYITVTDIVNNKVVLTANTINPWGAYCTTNLYWNSGGSTGDVYIANSWLYSKPCGSITADTDNVTLSNVPTRVGESLNVTVTPKDGYTLKSVTYNGTTVEATDNTASVTVKGGEDAQTLSISLEGVTQPTPTVAPTVTPTVEPTVAPTATPTTAPTAKPTATPTVVPTVAPTLMPTVVPTVAPTLTPTPDEGEKEYLEIENSFKDAVTIEKTYTENGDVVLTITSAEEMEFNFYTAVYDSDSVLKKVSITPCEMVDGKTILTVTKPEIADNEMYKLMLWTDGQTPVIKAISSAVQSFFR